MKTCYRRSSIGRSESGSSSVLMFSRGDNYASCFAHHSQFWRNTADADVGRFLRIFTELPKVSSREACFPCVSLCLDDLRACRSELRSSRRYKAPRSTRPRRSWRMRLRVCCTARTAYPKSVRLPQPCSAVQRRALVVIPELVCYHSHGKLAFRRPPLLTLPHSRGSN